MEDYSAASFIQAFIRFSCDVGYPKIVMIDEGSQLLKGCESMKLNFEDIKGRIHLNQHVEVSVCPVGGHNMHGKVERRIREVRKSIEQSVQNERLSVIQWETLAAEIANTINDQPLTLGNVVDDFENADILTPNRLRLGRNNNRSPEGPMTITNVPEKFIKDNEKIFTTWFETWLVCHVPKLVHQPKWFNADQDIKEGDVVLFTKQDSSISRSYQYGKITKTYVSADRKIRKVDVKYRNSNEKVDRETTRAVRQLIMIHPVDETSLFEELHECFRNARQLKFL